MKITELETPVNAEKYFAPKTDDEYPFYVTECGKTFRDTPCYQLRLNSNIACVQYVISGAGVIICNDRIYTVRGGDTFLLPEGSDQIYYSNPDNRFERIWLNFKGVLAQKLIDVYKLNDAVVFKNTDTFDILSRILPITRLRKSRTG